MSDFRATPNERGPTYRSQQEAKKIQLLGELSQALDVQHHDTPERHTFGQAFDAPTAVEEFDPGITTSFVGVSDSPARSDHRHGWVATPWTTVGSLLNGWANFGGGWQVARYRKVNDYVEIQGVITGGTSGAQAFTLPVGFRPPAHVMIEAGAPGGSGYTHVQSDGLVVPVTPNNTFHGLNCIVSLT